MTRSELVAAVYAEHGRNHGPSKITRKDICAVVDTIFEDITVALAKGERVEVPEKHKVYFRPGRAIQARLNQDAG